MAEEDLPIPEGFEVVIQRTERQDFGLSFADIQEDPTLLETDPSAPKVVAWGTIDAMMQFNPRRAPEYRGDTREEEVALSRKITSLEEQRDSLIAEFSTTPLGFTFGAAAQVAVDPTSVLARESISQADFIINQLRVEEVILKERRKSVLSGRRLPVIEDVRPNIFGATGVNIGVPFRRRISHN